MPCFCPLDVWPAPPDAADRRPVFSPQASYAGARSFRLPCGQCAGCRIGRADQWSTRIMHEASCHDSSVFVTETFSDEHLPADLSVSVRTHQLFIKRVRNNFGPVRYFGAGEYGDRTLRPHYHTILFGLELPDRYLWKRTPSGALLYRSPALELCWPFGHCLIGDVTAESAAYVARYCMKKLSGPPAADRYSRSSVDPETGEVRSWNVQPEFAVMSRKPGLGSAWLSEFASDCFPSDFLIRDGRKVPVPSFYKAKLDELAALRVVADRKKRARLHAGNNTDARLLVRREVHARRVALLRRSLEAEE